MFHVVSGREGAGTSNSNKLHLPNVHQAGWPKEHNRGPSQSATHTNFQARFDMTWSQKISSISPLAAPWFQGRYRCSQEFSGAFQRFSRSFRGVPRDLRCFQLLSGAFHEIFERISGSFKDVSNSFNRIQKSCRGVSGGSEISQSLPGMFQGISRESPQSNGAQLKFPEKPSYSSETYLKSPLGSSLEPPWTPPKPFGVMVFWEMESR